MVMERMRGLPISQVDNCAVWVSFCSAGRGRRRDLLHQVFRDGFFHADMHRATSSSPPTGRTRARTSPSTSASSARCPTSTKLPRHQLPGLSSRDYHSLPGRAHPDPAGRRRRNPRGQFEAAIALGVRAVLRPAVQESQLGRVLLRLVPDLARQFNVESSRNWYCCRRPCSTSAGLGPPTRSRPRLCKPRFPSGALDERTGRPAPSINSVRRGHRLGADAAGLPCLLPGAAARRRNRHHAPNSGLVAEVARCATCSGWRWPPECWSLLLAVLSRWPRSRSTDPRHAALVRHPVSR